MEIDCLLFTLSFSVTNFRRKESKYIVLEQDSTYIFWEILYVPPVLVASSLIKKVWCCNKVLFTAWSIFFSPFFINSLQVALHLLIVLALVVLTPASSSIKCAYINVAKIWCLLKIDYCWSISDRNRARLILGIIYRSWAFDRLIDLALFFLQ